TAGESTTLEARWITRGPVPDVMSEFVGPFGEPNEEREDLYLIDAARSMLGVKIRAGTHLDIKVPGGSAGSLRLPNGARSRLELWTKWTFPLDSTSLRLPKPHDPDWVCVEKVRRRRWFEQSDS